MIGKRSRSLARRSDLLLILLSLLVTSLLFARYAPRSSELIELPRVEPAAGTEAPVAASGEQVDAEMPTDDLPAAGAPVRFLMYNVQNYNVERDVPRSRFKRTLKPVAQREAVADVIARVRPDIVGLVEMGGEAALDDLAVRLASRGLNYPYRKALTRWGEDRALAILSRYPIAQDHSKAECSLVGQTNRRMLRGILDVTLRLPDKRCFRIMGVHLKSRVSDSASAAQALRAREARTLVVHAAQAARTQPNMPILVFGDWNDGPGDPALGPLSQGRSGEAALRRLNPADERDESWTIYYKAGNQYCTFDQIYVNDVLSKRIGRKSRSGIESGKNASDHRAVWCEIR